MCGKHVFRSGVCLQCLENRHVLGEDGALLPCLSAALPQHRHLAAALFYITAPLGADILHVDPALACPSRPQADQPRQKTSDKGPCQTASGCGILCPSAGLHDITKDERLMSKICVVCGKKPSFGNNRSHSMRATPRRWDPNLQKVRILLNGKPTRAYVCAKCLKANKVQKVA